MAPPKRPILWASEARADLDEIWAYYERVAGRNTAERIIRQIGETVRLIQDHPLIGRARDEVRRGLRSLATTPHVVFYRVVGEVPQIVRVLDGRRDIDDIFSEGRES